MRKNDLLKKEGTIVRVLAVENDKLLLIDCSRMTMPRWGTESSIADYVPCGEHELPNCIAEDVETLKPDSRKVAYQRYTIISGILPFISDDTMRNKAINISAEVYKASKKTISRYLCLYLAYQTITALAPKLKEKKRELTKDEKNMRWALNKFFYCQHKNSLKTTYTLMLKSKYCDGEGKLQNEYPSFYQFRYFYRKNKKWQTYYISRHGLSNYQRNKRPLLGEGVRQFAPAPGVGMIDSTVCDIYLVDDVGNLVGRPNLTACVDAYSGLCCGYSLSWEGGVYNLRNLLLNVVEDKVQFCSRFGISIKNSDWPAKELPGKLITDKGTEFISDTFAQITELGVTVTNLPPYRPDLKGPIEKFFDIVQENYKPYLKGKGVVDPDYADRGARDYRKDACLTLKEFEKIILHCIIYYNSRRVLDSFPCTEEMIAAGVKPNANHIFDWGKSQPGANLISVNREQLIFTLLPRTTGKFSRHGLKANKLRYHNPDFKEKYLQGGEVTVAYNPVDVSFVWLAKKGEFIKFELIDSRFQGKTLDEVQDFNQKAKSLIADASSRIQEEVKLAKHIEVIAQNTVKVESTNLKNIRNNRLKEQNKQRIDHIRRTGINDK